MKRQTILWADDDQDDLMVMREVLEQIDHSFEIIEVYNGQEAIEFLKGTTPDSDNFPCLIILDINMPVMNGKEALIHIKNDEVLKTVPVVIFTTSNSEMDRIFCKRYDAVMITKPPSFETLRDVVLELLSYCKK